jgi:hypothetical protein
MQIVSNLTDAIGVTDPGIRKLLEQRFNQLCPNKDDAETDTQFFIIEPVDEIEELEDATGCPIVTSWFSNAIYPDDNFAPCFEFIEEHRCCFEMVFVLNDDSSTVVLIVPKQQAINALLLELCREFSNEVHSVAV